MHMRAAALFTPHVLIFPILATPWESRSGREARADGPAGPKGGQEDPCCHCVAADTTRSVLSTVLAVPLAWLARA